MAKMIDLCNRKMRNKNKWIKIKDGKKKEMNECWYCLSPTNSILEYENGDEMWCCEKCAWEHGKIRKLRKKYKENKEILKQGVV